MEILAIQHAKQPIGIKTNIRICDKCQAILNYNYEDIWVKHIKNEEINFITCPSCNKDLNVGESKNLH